ncbi:MAG: alpha-mannosidase, partial [Phycisphaerae bacterium]|nr:alpha-mannosidase [Phycisphaerae bacterium]
EEKTALKLVPLQSNDDVILRKSILQAGEAIRKDVYESDCFRGDGLMYLVGHSHLDIVFLWPYKEYLRKAARTHTTVLRLMEQYPQFKFCQSQPKLYADLKEHYPTVYEQIKQRIAEGRWEPIGAMWVEPDCNLISGESFVRQILHGQRFYEQEFGMRSRTCWLPDVFGLSWALPQILARSGIEYAITNKMVPWNDTNPWQKNTVWWEGADGSRVLGIVPPGHFIGTVDPDVIDAQWRAFSDQQTVGQTLHVYGWGDGGGGPDPEMIESGQRYQDFPGLAKMKFAHAEEAFDNIAERVAEVGAPVHRDEIYLEAHRGMHTTRGKLKMLNRRMEFLLRSAELAAAMAWVDGADYPLEEINEAWQRTLTAQFHDSLPGTHVAEVYPMLLGEYDRAGELARDIRAEAMRALLGNGSTDTLTVFNPLDRERNDHIAVAADILKGRTVLDHGGKPLPGQQVITLAGEEKVLFRVGEFPAVGYGTFALEQVSQAPAADGGPTAEDKALENEYLRAVFNESGELVRLYDKQADREVLLDKRASNVFRMYEDTPGHYEAWDIVDTYREHEIALQRIANIAVDEQGPIRASLMIEKTLGNSKLRQRVSLYAGSRQLVFETEIDWLERQRLLKVGFDVDVNARTATYDIAYGHIERANHRNTTQDAARFEVNGHLWADLSQADCGVSILTDSKYGYEIEEKRMQLTLLKGPTYPDPDSDREMHHFTYALLPHTGDWRAGGTHDEALKLNDPMLALPSNANAGQCVSLFRCDAETLYLEAMKRSEDGEGLVLRLLERHNARARGTLTFDRPVHAAWSCDLMEDNRTELPIEDGRVKVDAKPCEIVTVYVQFR